MRIRIRFEKTGPIRFVGHLDFMRTFQKIIKKSGLNAAYTVGFNPHMLISFAAPLGVGEETSGDYTDVDFAYKDTVELTQPEENRLRDIGIDNETAPVPPTEAEFLAMLNAAMPEGVKATAAVRVGIDKSSKCMALVRYASWNLTLGENALPGLVGQQLVDTVAAFASQDEIVVHKKTKKSEKDVDIKPLIVSLGADTDEGGRRVVHLTCASGSTENLKPVFVLEALAQYAGESLPTYSYRTMRTETMDEEMRPLGTLGTAF